MSFILRAALVIGVLSYLAAQRQPAHGPAEARPPSASDAAALWSALPAPAREHVLREATMELGQQLQAAIPSRDTLSGADRHPAWRGADKTR